MMLAARIDRLAPEDKRLLQVPALGEMTPIPATMYREMGVRFWLEQAEAELASLR